jgi:hypothetical protein
MKKLILALCGILLFAPGVYAACAQKHEKQSLHMRALQSELMVAALACGKKAEYNRYVNSFSNDLRWQGRQLKSYFNRMHGSRGEFEMNRFVTEMANQASRLSLTRSSAKYCENAGKLFSKVNNYRPWQVIDLAANRYDDWTSVKSCPTTQVVAAAR